MREIDDVAARIWVSSPSSTSPSPPHTPRLRYPDAAVSSSFNIGPHLSRRRESYDWPNPFWPAYWGRGATDCGEFPSPSEIDYLALDLTYYQGDGALYPEEAAFIDSLIADDGEFDVIFEEDNVIVARRVEPGPDGVALPPNCPGVNPLAPVE